MLTTFGRVDARRQNRTIKSRDILRLEKIVLRFEINDITCQIVVRQLVQMVNEDRNVLTEEIVYIWRKRTSHIVNRTIGQVTILVILVVFYGFG